jgi:1-acyl-sn-glycerol-3-phosphate acyltransferase
MMYIMLKNALRSMVIWTVGAALTILLYFVMLFVVLFTFPFDKQRRLAHKQCFWWAAAVAKLNPCWAIKVAGLENIDNNKTYVVVANHQSLADIVVMYHTKMQFKWVAKESLFEVPFVGWSLGLAKHIKLERGKFTSIKNVYREAAKWLKGGMSVLFFPEGTRSETGEIKDFQNGAFKLAIKERVPILPMAIKGTGGAIPKGSWILTPKIPISLKALPAIDTAHFEMKDFAKLRDLTRSLLENA